VQKIRSLIQDLNKKKEVEVLEPNFVIISAFMMPAFKKHMASLKIDYIYEKPL